MRFTRSIMAFGLAFILCLSMQTAAAAAATTATHPSPATASSTSEAAQVNINLASAEQLKKIKGIGASKAEAIVNYRTEHGPFKSVEDLSNVKGFSTKVVDSIVKKNPGVMAVE